MRRFSHIIMIVGFVFAGHLSSAQEGSSAIDVQLGSTQLRVFLGNVVDQKTNAIVVSHWPTSINNGGGVGGAVADAGGMSAFQHLQDLIKQKGSLEYTSVYPAEVPPGQRLKAGTILNVIELKPANRITFDSSSELGASQFPLPPKVIRAYHEFLAQHGVALVADTAARDALWQQHIQEKSVESFERWLRSDGGRELYELKRQRDAIIRDSLKPVGFDTVVETVYNALGVAAQRGLHSVSIPTLGYGIMGDLSMKESIQAIATATQLHQLNAATTPGSEPVISEVRIVLFARDSVENKKKIAGDLKADLISGQFLKVAAEMMPRYHSKMMTALAALSAERTSLNEAQAAPRAKGGFMAAVNRWLGFGPGSATMARGEGTRCEALFVSTH